MAGQRWNPRATRRRLAGAGMLGLALLLGASAQASADDAQRLVMVSHSPAMIEQLEKKGYDVGSADGLPGFKTRRSIGDWQAKNGRAATCFPDAELVRAVQ